MSAPASVPTIETNTGTTNEPAIKTTHDWSTYYTDDGQFKGITPGMGWTYHSGGECKGMAGVANKCRARGDSYLPASMAGQPVPYGAIGSVPTLGHATVEVERTVRKTTRPDGPVTLGPTTITTTAKTLVDALHSQTDWETQYHIAEANVILLRAENERMRERLGRMGVTVTGKPGLATIG